MASFKPAQRPEDLEADLKEYAQYLKEDSFPEPPKQKPAEPNFDPTLTPRARWEKQVLNLNSLLEQEREKCRLTEMAKLEERVEFEKQLLESNRLLNEAK